MRAPAIANTFGRGLHVPLIGAVLVLLVLLGASGLRANSAASLGGVGTNVTVLDAVDGWLGGASTVDGDLALAESVIPAGVVVAVVDGDLRFEAAATNRGRAESERIVADALTAYSAARDVLRAGLEERLQVVSELTSFVERRSDAFNNLVVDVDSKLAKSARGQGPALRAERAAAIAAALDFESRGEDLLLLSSTTLAPAWATTPVVDRLARLDELLGAAFWFAAGENI